jgi:hypothetical protein
VSFFERAIAGPQIADHIVDRPALTSGHHAGARAPRLTPLRAQREGILDRGGQAPIRSALPAVSHT